MNYFDKQADEQGTLSFFNGKYKYFSSLDASNDEPRKSSNLLKEFLKLFSTELDDWLDE